MNILIAIPCYGGMVQAECIMSLIQLNQLLNVKRIAHTIVPFADSLVTRVRNYFANMAAFDTDARRNRFSHLLQIDADSRFEPGDILRMLEVDRPIVGLPYALKNLKWDQIGHAARLGMPDNLLEYFGADVNFNTTPISVDQATPIPQIGCGTMLIKTEVLDAMVARHPEWKYRLYPSEIEEVQANGGNRDYAYDFFRPQIDAETRYYLSEDFAFCEEARRLGFEVYVLPGAATGHVGTYEYKLNLPLLAAAGLNVRNMLNQPQETKV